MQTGTIGGNIQDELGVNTSAEIDFNTGVLSVNENGQIVLHKEKSVSYSNGSVALVTWPSNYLVTFEANPRYSLIVRASGRKTMLGGKFVNHAGTTVLIGNL